MSLVVQEKGKESKFTEIYNKLEAAISLLITAQAQLKVLEQAPRETKEERRKPSLQASFPDHDPDCLNKGPLNWLKKQLEKEQEKGHLEVWISRNDKKITFSVYLKPDVSSEDPKKIQGWFDWAKKAVMKEEIRNE